MKPGRSLVGLSVVAVAAVLLGSGFGLFAQAQTPSGGSLAEVAAEIRLLRTALEENGNKQTLASMLSAQQARLQPHVSQLAEVRKQLDEAMNATRTLNTSLLSFQAEPPGSAAQASARTGMLKQMQASLQAAQIRESELRGREVEAAQAMQREEAVWLDLMNRLQQSIKR